MKLYLTLCIALSVLGTVLSDPMPSRRYYGNVPLYYDAYRSYAQSYANAQGGMPGNEFEDMKKQKALGEMEELAEAQQTGVMNGNTLVMQYDKNKYLKCPTSGSGSCAVSTCPGVVMDTSEWTSCGENVFRIYRRNGAGAVQVGDYVALYFPSASGWFSMWNSNGHIEKICPGTLNTNIGFQTDSRWDSCRGEVFRIFAYNKNIGQNVQDQDMIFLWYEVGEGYVRFSTDPLSLGRCASGWPPTIANYDSCLLDDAKIKLQ